MITHCPRDGCPGVVSQVGPYCTHVCKLIAEELRYVEKLCRRYSSDPTLTDRWASLVGAADAWSSYRAAVEGVGAAGLREQGHRCAGCGAWAQQTARDSSADSRGSGTG